MIANVHRYRGALPGSRADLYAEIMQVMLVRRQEAKDLPVELADDKKEALLRGLAYAMMDRRLSDLPYDEVLAEIRPALRRLPRQVTAEGFLADVRSMGCLSSARAGCTASPTTLSRNTSPPSTSATRAWSMSWPTRWTTRGGGRPPCCTPPAPTLILSWQRA